MILDDLYIILLVRNDVTCKLMKRKAGTLIFDRLLVHLFYNGNLFVYLTDSEKA